jgi:hypothetical protein
MRKGEESFITICPSYAYGAAGTAAVTGNSSLRYHVELIPRRLDSLWDRVALWEEKGKLEAFLWGGCAFSSAAAAAAAGGGRGTALDVRGYVLARLEAMAGFGLSDQGEIVGAGAEEGGYYEAGGGVGAGGGRGGPLPGYEGEGSGLGSSSGGGGSGSGSGADAPLLPTDAQILAHYWLTMMDEACAHLCSRDLRVRGAPPKNSDRLFSNNFVEFGGARGGGVARGSIFAGPEGETGGHPTRRIKLVIRSEAPRFNALLRVDGGLFHTHTPGEGRPGVLPRTLAFFAALLLHEIPGQQMGEVSLADGTVVPMREGLEAAIAPWPGQAAWRFWEKLGHALL